MYYNWREGFSSVEEMKAEVLKAVQNDSSNKSIFTHKEISSNENKQNSAEVTRSLPPHVKVRYIITIAALF